MMNYGISDALKSFLLEEKSRPVIGCIESALGSLIVGPECESLQSGPLSKDELIALFQKFPKREKFGMLISALDSKKGRLNKFNGEPIRNLNDLNNAWNKANADGTLRGDPFGAFKESAMQGYDVAHNFAQQVHVICFLWKKWGALNVIVGRGKVTGETHVNKLKEMTCDKAPGVNFYFGYWPFQIIETLKKIGNDPVLMISIGVVTKHDLAPGEMVAPTKIVEFIETDWTSHPIDISFSNACADADADSGFLSANLAALQGILN